MRGTGLFSSEIRVFKIVAERLPNDCNMCLIEQKNAEMVRNGFQARIEGVYIHERNILDSS